MAVNLTIDDLAPFAEIEPLKAAEMIDDVVALAARVAPCILEPDFAHDTAARAILRAAVLRWHETGTGAVTTQSIDDYSQTIDTRQQRRGMFWPSEITMLQDLCRTEKAGAFTVDTVPTALVQHADICALRFGGLYCSCGAVLTMDLPLYENL